MERPLTTEPLEGETATRRLPTSGGERGREAATTRLDDVARGGPRVLDRYRLERRLGAGGHGTVWLAWDERLEREVALKVIPREGGPGLQRAEREARVAARLNHPGIVALYELGQDQEAVYLVSELVRGATFAELLRAGALSDRDVARIGSALCDALTYAHRAGVVHRDVKPGNVMVVDEPAAGAGFAKLTDFGVAHLATGDPLTRTGDVIGTLAYMAPEQAEGLRVTPAADVYALALTLYEGWTGENPVRARGAVATARRLGQPLPPLGGRRRDLPAGLCAEVDAALDPEPDRRPSPRELRRTLDAAESRLADEGGLVESGTLERFGLAPRSRRWGGDASLALRVPDRAQRLGARLLAGAATGGLVLLALERLGPGSPASSGLSAPAAGLVAAVLVALLPRVGWLAAGAGLVAWLAAPDADRTGAALVVAGAVAVVPLLLPRAGLLWSIPALAPLLGALGLAPLYLAVAGLGSTLWRRLGLGAAGFLWLAGAEALADRALLFGVADGTGQAAAWRDSLRGVLDDAYVPFFTSLAPTTAVLWALLAATLPLLVRGRSPALDLLGAGVWAAAAIVSHRALGDLLSGTVQLDTARGLVAGVVLGALVAVAARVVLPPRAPGTEAPLA